MVVISNGRLFHPHSTHSYAEKNKDSSFFLGWKVGFFWSTHSLKVKSSSAFTLF